MLHSEYRENLTKYLTAHSEDKTFGNFLQEHKKEFLIMASLNLDPAIKILESVYSPVHRRPARDPVCMLRFLLLMTLFKVASITQWIKQVRSVPFLAVLAGFAPDDVPGIGTCYDFMRRIIDGPYQKPCQHIVRRSQNNTGQHKRNIKSEKEAKKAAQKDDQNPHQSQSEKLVQEILPQAGQPRADDFRKILEDLLIQIGVIPSIEQGLITGLDHLVVSGDGSILGSGASAHGKPTCSCRSEGIYDCQHDRIYSSSTATWCYDAYRDCFLFGDRYYHLITHQNGHDFPLMTIMPGGNESDYTLSIRDFDRFLKASRENNLKIHIDLFCGDGHHDSYAHYEYFAAKQVIPIIPLAEKSKKVIPHLPETQKTQTASPVKVQTDSVAETQTASSAKAQADSTSSAKTQTDSSAKTQTDSPAKTQTDSPAKTQTASPAKTQTDSPVRLDTDGTPLCPAGAKMRHHGYDKKKQTHIYNCPAKRNTHRDGTCIYVTHLEECPRKQDCAPDSPIGPLVYIKSDTDPRLYPPILRESKRFKDLMKQRTATERCNYLNDTYHLDKSCRNADYGLVRLSLVNIVEHAVIRYLEAVKRSSEIELFNQTLREITPALLRKAA
jgi:hypothetical protein